MENSSQLKCSTFENVNNVQFESADSAMLLDNDDYKYNNLSPDVLGPK